MKKSILLSLAILLFAATLPAQHLSFTAVRKNGAVIDTAAYIFKAASVQYVQKTASNSVIGYRDFYSPNALVTYTLTDNFDTVYAKLNGSGTSFVKVQKIAKIARTSRDTATYWIYPIDKVGEAASYSAETLPQAHSRTWVSTLSGVERITLKETAAQFHTSIDSILAVAKGFSKVVYDTANYTMQNYDKHIILNSTTADTLTFKNPALFYDKGSVVIANIGSGAYTIAGGFTVKDKSGSNVTSLTANTVYTFKSYYNGSAYIWLKEY